MRGNDIQQNELFSYGSLEERVPESHPLRPIRQMVDEALKQMSGRFDEIYGSEGRPSIAPERLLRALLLQILYSVRSERMFCEQLDYNLLFRWFLDLNWDEPAVEAAMHDVLRFWLRRGVDGFRMDVLYRIAKDPHLGEDEPGRRHDQDWETMQGRLAGIRVERGADSVLAPSLLDAASPAMLEDDPRS